jgi:ABC-type transport system involved in Fe-S cluster assembly fused permease/ATPase subunit
VFSVTVTGTVVLYFVWTLTVTEWRTKFRTTMLTKSNQVSETNVDSLINSDTVKLFTGEEYEAQRYGRSLRDYNKSTVVVQGTLVLLNAGQNLIMSLGLLTCMLLAAGKVRDAKIGVGSFLMIVLYLQNLMAPLSWLGTAYRMIQSAAVDLSQMLDLMETEPGIVDVEDAIAVPALGHGGAEVAFDNVSFSYKAGGSRALSGVSFRVGAGKSLGIVGPSGSGKSTICRLLFRLYEATDGTITLNHADIKAVRQRDLRSRIGIVPQEATLFNDTVENNIAYGRPGVATHDEVVRAAREAQIADRIDSFPEKYDTRVGERGLRLSGGEKQRVSIARMIIKNPDVIVLDESTSALDSVTEQAIQGKLNEVSKGKCTLIVAHRLSTVMNCDEIIVLREGVITERGSHDSLMAIEGGHYRDMWERQQGKTD